MIVLAAPDRQGSTPVPRSRQRPVDVVAQPVTVATPLDRRRVPVRGLVLSQQFILDRGGPDVPRRQRVVDQRRVAAPAVRVGVLVGHPLEQQPARGKVRHQGLVGVFEELPAHERHVGLEVAIGQHRVDHRQVVVAADREVIGAERGGEVHDAGTIGGGDEVPDDHVMRVRDLHQVERPTVVDTLEFAALETVQDLGVLAQRGGN